MLRPLTRKPGQSFYLPTLLVSSLNVCELALNSATRAECVLQWLPNIWLLKRRLGEPPVYLFSSALLDCLQFSSPQLSYISCSLSPAFFEINAIYNAEKTLYNKATLDICSVPNLELGAFFLFMKSWINSRAFLFIIIIIQIAINCKNSRTPYTVYSKQYTVYGIQYIVNNKQYTIK